MVVPGRSQFSTRPRDEDPLGSERKRGGTHRSVGAHQLNRRGTGRPIRVIPCFPKQGSRFLEPYTFVHPVEIISRDPLNVQMHVGLPRAWPPVREDRARAGAKATIQIPGLRPVGPGAGVHPRVQGKGFDHPDHFIREFRVATCLSSNTFFSYLEEGGAKNSDFGHFTLKNH